MQVGTTKDQGLYNKPSAAVHPGALAAGTLPQYNTIQYNRIKNKWELSESGTADVEMSCVKSVDSEEQQFCGLNSLHHY